MKLPFNLGFGKAGRRRKGSSDEAVDEVPSGDLDDDDGLDAGRSRTVILDDPDAEDDELGQPLELEEARPRPPAAATEDEEAVEAPFGKAEDLPSIFLDDEFADNEGEKPKRRFLRTVASVVAGGVGLLAIGSGGWWLAQHGGGGES